MTKYALLYHVPDLDHADILGLYDTHEDATKKIHDTIKQLRNICTIKDCVFGDNKTTVF